MTKADDGRRWLLEQVGEEYEWGEEGPDEWDCSGLAYGLFHEVGFSLPRLTANDYWEQCAKLEFPSRVGDLFFCFNSSGHATHVGCYAGKQDEVEARGEAYGVVHASLSSLASRGVKWGRLPGYDFGELTEAGTEYKVFGVSTRNTNKRPSDFSFEEEFIEVCQKYGKAVYETKEQRTLPSFPSEWYRKG